MTKENADKDGGKFLRKEDSGPPIEMEGLKKRGTIKKERGAKWRQ